MPRQSLNPADYIGKKYNKLLILEYAGIRSKSMGHFFKCKCDCGNEAIVRLIKMKTGATKACGCLMGKGNKRKGESLSKTNKRLYSIWNSMMQRCFNTRCVGYRRYGARGILVSPEWWEFRNFIEWAENNGYKSDLSLDRKDNNKGYGALNCRWVTFKKQQNNKSNNVFITYKGITLPAQEWSERTGIKATIIINRYKKGWALDKVFSKKIYASVI